MSRPDDNPPEAQCHGKHSYPSAVIARRVAQRARVGHLRPYRCACCGRWHIGRGVKAKGVTD